MGSIQEGRMSLIMRKVRGEISKWGGEREEERRKKNRGVTMAPEPAGSDSSACAFVLVRQSTHTCARVPLLPYSLSHMNTNACRCVHT